MSASCSVCSGQSHRDAAEHSRIGASSADDLNQFLSADAGTCWNLLSRRSQQNIDKVVSTAPVNDWIVDTEEMHWTAVNVDSPAANGSSVAHRPVSERPSVPRDSAQDSTSV